MILTSQNTSALPSPMCRGFLKYACWITFDSPLILTPTARTLTDTQTLHETHTHTHTHTHVWTCNSLRQQHNTHILRGKQILRMVRRRHPRRRPNKTSKRCGHNHWNAYVLLMPRSLSNGFIATTILHGCDVRRKYTSIYIYIYSFVVGEVAGNVQETLMFCRCHIL